MGGIYGIGQRTGWVGVPSGATGPYFAQQYTARVLISSQKVPRGRPVGIGRRVLQALKIVAWVPAVMAAVLVTVVTIFIVLFVIEQGRMEGKAREVRAWIAAEIPADSTVPHTFAVLDNHGVQERYYQNYLLTAAIRYPSSLLNPVESGIFMRFNYDKRELLVSATVEVAYTFL